MAYTFTRTGAQIEEIHNTVDNIYNTLGNSNLLSNHNFLIPSPDDSQPAPSATPTSYPPGFQIFSGIFANETTGILNLTYIDGRVSFSGGDFYMPVQKTGALENITEFVASVADFDGKPRTRGVSYALVGGEYRVTVGVDALEDESANETLLGSVKFEQGSVATGHSVQSAKGQVYTFNSVADAVTNCPPVGSKLIVEDYYGGVTPNNSGVLFFKVVVGGTGTADGGKYIDIPVFNLQLEQNLQLPVRATAYGAISDAWGETPSDSAQFVKSAIQYCADAGIAKLNLDGNFYFEETIRYSTGLHVFGDGPMDALNSLTRKGYGTAIISTANPVFEILNSDELPSWPQDSGSSANVGLSDLTLYSQSAISATGLRVGSDTAGIRNVTIDNIESRGYAVAIDIKAAYTLFMSRLSLRGLGRGVGTRGVLFSGGEVTSGYLNGIAVYDQEVAIECQSGVFAGFTISNVDTDACNHVAITSGFIYNPALFRNIASEGTITSDFIFDHSSGVCGVDNFATVVGVTTDHRIRCAGAGRTVIRNVALNSSLVPSGKRQISQEGGGSVEIYGSFDPRFGLNKQGSGDVTINDALYSEPTPLVAANTGISFTRTKNWHIRIGSITDERTIVLDLSRCTPMAGQLIHNVNTSGGTNIGLYLIQKSSVGANFLDIQAASGDLTKIDDNTFELAFTATHNNGAVVLSVPDSVDVYRKDIGPS